jgi:hypothetical protein
VVKGLLVTILLKVHLAKGGEKVGLNEPVPGLVAQAQRMLNVTASPLVLTRPHLSEA